MEIVGGRQTETLSSKAGHKEGVKKARLAVEYALEKKIDYLTLICFQHRKLAERGRRSKRFN